MKQKHDMNGTKDKKAKHDKKEKKQAQPRQQVDPYPIKGLDQDAMEQETIPSDRCVVRNNNPDKDDSEITQQGS